MTIVFQKFRRSLNVGGGVAFMVFLLYGAAFLILLFNTVHDRSNEEFKNRLVPRYNQSIIVWIKNGYFAHGGLGFLKPLQEEPKQKVWRSNTMGYLQFGHLLQRIHYAFTGEFGYYLMAVHNQFFPMLSSVLLGFLAMRLTLQLKIPPLHAFILGLSALTVFQTFPITLGAIWENYHQDVWQTFAIFFLIRENSLNWKGYEKNNSFLWALLIFLMFFISPYVTFFFISSYGVILFTTMLEDFKVYKFLKSVFFAGGCAVLIMAIQINWVQFNYPHVFLEGSSVLFRTGLDGDNQYYYNHWDLLWSQYIPWLPRWKILLFLGTFATVAVIYLAQCKRKHLSHQTTLFVGIGSFLPMAIFFSQNGVIHLQCYEHLLAVPLILALFALLPAWLETFNRNSGVFVLFSSLIAFAFSGAQMLSYWVHMPPYFLY
jgi:hypothetical protein